MESRKDAYMESRKNAYDRKTKELSERCMVCRSGVFKPSIERCEECTTGRRMRMLETEYADVTGWSHTKW